MDSILVKEKHGDYIVSGDTIGQAAMIILEGRVRDEYWYDNWDDGNPQHQWRDRAEAIFEAQDYDAAWRFLEERAGFEHEWVEIARSRGRGWST